MPDNSDYTSQFPNTELGNALRAQVEIRHEFYKEYAIEDHDHEHISKISQVAAMALVQSSPYRPFLTDLMIDSKANESITCTPRYITNKGAIRIVPTVQFRDVLKGIHKLLKAPDKNHELWDPLRGWLASFYKSDQDRYELWVYNHDGAHYLTRPRKKPMIHRLNQKLQQILQGIDARGLGDAPSKARDAICQLGMEFCLTVEDESEINKGLRYKIKFPHIERDSPETIMIDLQGEQEAIMIDLQEE